jgi:uncharacterized protein with ParB-like and HNH nuclease domain
MASTIFLQERPSFGSLIGNGRVFEVPSFQRDYSWDQNQWEDLWLDIVNLEGDEDHYLGYIVLQETSDSKRFIIIDGQQRIATLSILILAAVKILEDWGDKERADLLRTSYISYKEPVSLLYKTKLRLNRNNDYIYSSRLVQLHIPPVTGSLKPSEKLICQAYDYFYKEFNALFKSKSAIELTTFINKRIDERLFFTAITVGDDINAYKVFETLNARGVKLSTADLLKNYLFSVVSAQFPGEVEDLEKKWYRIHDLLGKTDITTYLRHFWNSRNWPLERKSSLFKTIKKKITTYESSIQLMKDLEDGVEIYIAFSNPDDPLWIDDQKKYFKEINVMGVSQCFPLLLTTKQKFTDVEFTKVLRDVCVISFRYNTIGGMNPNEMERVYAKASNAVYSGSSITARHVFDQLKEVYIADNVFKVDFANAVLNTNKDNKLAKYILGKIDSQMGGSPLELDNRTVTIEHVLPESLDDEWIDAFGNTAPEPYIYRIGNLILLEKAKNNEAARKSFEEKRTIYASSSFASARSIEPYTDWDSEAIARRQSEMARLAAGIWKISY